MCALLRAHHVVVGYIQGTPGEPRRASPSASSPEAASGRPPRESYVSMRPPFNFLLSVMKSGSFFITRVSTRDEERSSSGARGGAVVVVV